MRRETPLLSFDEKHVSHSYAQTNVQLFNQLLSEGYSQEDREVVRVTYEFAMVLFTGLFLPSGKPFIDHLVGTASILASLHVPVEMVAAGLIHAAYLHGDFGGTTSGISETKREQVRGVVGEAIEDYVAKYDRLLWNAQKIGTIHDNLADLGPIDREVLLIRLANELEHQLDLGGMYFAESEKGQERHQRYMKSYGPMLMSMAERLGFSALAAEMAQVFKNVISTHVPVEPWIRSKHQVAYLAVPRSYRERFSATFSRKVSDSHRFCSRIPNRISLLFRKVVKVYNISSGRRTV
jgi:(p)ppGpp synthase/HD superfamily hydrolase